MVQDQDVGQLLAHRVPLVRRLHAHPFSSTRAALSCFASWPGRRGPGELGSVCRTADRPVGAAVQRRVIFLCSMSRIAIVNNENQWTARRYYMLRTMTQQ